MKAIVGIVAVVLLLAVAGWISFSSSGGNPSVEFHPDKAEHDIKALEEKVESELKKTSPPASNQ